MILKEVYENNNTTYRGYHHRFLEAVTMTIIGIDGYILVKMTFKLDSLFL